MANTGCWACANGVQSPVTATLHFRSPYTIDDLLGCCWECHVFSCSGHAERDTDSGKWLCFPSVAKALAASAGVDDGEHVATRFASTKEFEVRLPILAKSTAELRGRFHNNRDMFDNAATRVGLDRELDPDVLADAVGVAASLVPPQVVQFNIMDDVRPASRAALFGGTFEAFLAALDQNV